MDHSVPGAYAFLIYTSEGTLIYTGSSYAWTTEEINRIVHDIATLRNGSISAEHGIGRRKLHELAHYKAPLEIELMRTLKRTLDPRNIMNPGKVVIP